MLNPSNGILTKLQVELLAQNLGECASGKCYKKQMKFQYVENKLIWLVVWNINFIFPSLLGISSSQLTFIFFRGVAQPGYRLEPPHVVFCVLRPYLSGSFASSRGFFATNLFDRNLWFGVNHGTKNPVFCIDH